MYFSIFIGWNEITNYANKVTDVKAVLAYRSGTNIDLQFPCLC